MEEVVVQVAQLEQTVNPSVQQVLLERFMAVPMAARPRTFLCPRVVWID
jgi:hypothetical protein